MIAHTWLQKWEKERQKRPMRSLTTAPADKYELVSYPARYLKAHGLATSLSMTPCNWDRSSSPLVTRPKLTRPALVFLYLSQHYIRRLISTLGTGSIETCTSINWLATCAVQVGTTTTKRSGEGPGRLGVRAAPAGSMKWQAKQYPISSTYVHPQPHIA